VIKANIDPTSHIVQALTGRQFNIEKEYFLKRLHTLHVARVNGNLSATLLAQYPAGKLIRGCGYLAPQNARQDLTNVFRKPELYPLGLVPH